MQIVEASSFGVRSAVVTLRHPDGAMRFVLFPMLHVGAPEFYQQVAARLGECQVVVAEGIRGRSSAARALTSTYRVLGYSRRFGLVNQDLHLRSLAVPIITPDMAGREFGRRWRRLPVLLQLTVACMVPCYAIGVLLFGSREFLARHATVDDLPSREDELADEWSQPLDELIGHVRDQRLLRALGLIHQGLGGAPLSVAVVYGARHIPAVVRYLRALGYRTAHADWLTVFAI